MIWDGKNCWEKCLDRPTIRQCLFDLPRLKARASWTHWMKLMWPKTESLTDALRDRTSFPTRRRSAGTTATLVAALWSARDMCSPQLTVSRGLYTLSEKFGQVVSFGRIGQLIFSKQKKLILKGFKKDKIISWLWFKRTPFFLCLYKLNLFVLRWLTKPNDSTNLFFKSCIKNFL